MDGSLRVCDPRRGVDHPNHSEASTKAAAFEGHRIHPITDFGSANRQLFSSLWSIQFVCSFMRSSKRDGWAGIMRGSGSRARFLGRTPSASEPTSSIEDGKAIRRATPGLSPSADGERKRETAFKHEPQRTKRESGAERVGKIAPSLGGGMALAWLAGPPSRTRTRHGSRSTGADSVSCS